MADLEAQVAAAVRRELERQAEAGDLTVSGSDGALTVNGRIDLEALAMALVGAVAGGP